MPAIRHLALILPVLALAACETATPQPPAGPQTCDDRFESLLGSNIGAVTLPAGLPHRIIAPGMAVTEDYYPNRLNLHIDEKGWITGVNCG